MIDKTVRHYNIIEKLGEGGMESYTRRTIPCWTAP